MISDCVGHEACLTCVLGSRDSGSTLVASMHSYSYRRVLSATSRRSAPKFGLTVLGSQTSIDPHE